MKKICYMLIMTVLISCQSDWRAIFHGGKFYDVLVCFPIIHKGDDSIMVYKSIGGLYLSQNIQLVSYNDFCTELYKHIKEKKCIEVDSILYSTLELNNRIDVDSTILQLYNEYGIDSLLNKYLDKEYEALYIYPPVAYNDQVNIEYILYLCSLHNIYFEDREVGGDVYGWFLWRKR